VIRSSETSVHTRTIRWHIPEECILHVILSIFNFDGDNLSIIGISCVKFYMDVDYNRNCVLCIHCYVTSVIISPVTMHNFKVMSDTLMIDKLGTEAITPVEK
jgi:hypothetical protein